MVETGGKWGFIDKSGKIVIPATWENAGPFFEGLAAVRTGGKWGFIDKSGTIVIPATWEEPGLFSEGLAAVKTGGKWGFIDKSGMIVIPATWDDVAGVVPGNVAMFAMVVGADCRDHDLLWGFSEGFAAVEKGGRWSFIDQSGNVLVADGLLPVIWHSEHTFKVEMDETFGGLLNTGSCGFVEIAP